MGRNTAGDFIADAVDDSAIIEAPTFPIQKEGVEVDSVALHTGLASLYEDKGDTARDGVAVLSQRLSFKANTFFVEQYALVVACSALKPGAGDAPGKAQGLTLRTWKQRLKHTDYPCEHADKNLTTIESLCMASDDNRVGVEIKGVLCGLLGIEIYKVDPTKASALVASIDGKRGDKVVVRWAIERSIEGRMRRAIQIDELQGMSHVQVGHYRFIQK